VFENLIGGNIEWWLRFVDWAEGILGLIGVGLEG
jgi:hypothetical protein